MDLFDAFPALRRHPLLSGKKVALIGVSTIVCDDTACYFEIGKPRYWQRREVKEELGVQVRLTLPRQTYLIHDWQIAGTLDLPPSKKRPTPLMVILLPPRLGGPDMPDYLSIVVLCTRLRGTPAPRDLFGLLRVENHVLAEFFARDEWPLDEAQAYPGLTLVLNDQLPPDPILRPRLTARAFQLLIRAGHAPCAPVSS